MPPVVTYLLLALCIAVFVVSLVPDRLPVRWRFRWLERYAMIVSFAALLGAYGLMRPGRGDDGEAAVRASLAAHQPLFLEFFSNS